MSRSSKGFADFFPTAPAVLKAQKKRESPSQDHKRVNRATSLATDQSRPKRSSSTQQTKQRYDGLAKIPAGPDVQEERELHRHDMSHEVSSASSVSTVSSMFSTQQVPAKPVGGHSSKQVAALTPLTVLDSSPRTNGVPSPVKKNINGGYSNELNPPTPSDQSLDKTYSESDPDEIDLPLRPQARPGKGLVKGHRIKYDPMMEKVIRTKDKRHKEPQYEAFGVEVGLKLPDHR